MKKKDKIKAIIVFGAFLIVIGIYVKLAIFSSDNVEEQEDKQFLITTPVIDENSIEDVSKIDQYDQEDGDEQLIALRLAKKDTEDNFSIDRRVEELTRDANTQREEVLDIKQESAQKQYEDELKEILKIQQQYEEASKEVLSKEPRETGDEEVEIEETDIASVATDTLVTKSSIDTAFNQPVPSTRFYGVEDSFNTDDIVDLIPAETVDQGIIIQGSTVAIRTKKAITLPRTAISIPQGAVLYGKAIFGGGNRLSIDIKTYKVNDKIYPLTFTIYDFDGREGIHLGNRSWSKIPSKVSKDIFDYSYVKGTNQSTFGGSNDINLEEVKNIALLSAAKEVGKELFDKRKVMLPRKYHLWININTQNL